MNEEKTHEEILEEADRLAAELDAELDSITSDGSLGDLEGLDQIPPELLEQMTPEQILELLANMNKKPRRSQAFYTRKQTPKSVRQQKRRAAKKARRITSLTGGGRTISRKRRLKKAA